MPEPRSVEWAEDCLQKHLPEMATENRETWWKYILCLDCARAYAAQVRQEEREACAKVAELELYDTHPQYWVCQRITAAIRAR